MRKIPIEEAEGAITRNSNSLGYVFVSKDAVHLAVTKDDEICTITLFVASYNESGQDCICPRREILKDLQAIDNSPETLECYEFDSDFEKIQFIAESVADIKARKTLADIEGSYDERSTI
jgi:hypothetical protein